MTRTARRRWTRELSSEVDGIAVGDTGPILLHGYDPPAGGMWIDDVIPGKLAALDRTSGEVLWASPCEVGYGRGFGAGIGNEDDVIVLGDFNADDRHFGRLGRVPGISWALSGIPTNTRGNKQYDNLVFHQTATREFTGRVGVFDFMREYNLTQDEALEVSDPLPVWAEFSIYEGGEIGRVAARPGG